MNALLNERDPQVIEEASNVLQVTPAVIEKDSYVTQALHALVGVESEYFYLVFHGGTCLAKAHQVIERMSEDCDFRIQAKNPSGFESKEARRRAIRDFRPSILTALERSGFSINSEQVSAKNSGQFMDVFLDYKPIFAPSVELRPQVKLEFSVVDGRVPVESKSVTSLVHLLFKEKIDQQAKSLLCVAVSETAAEKWVALTRRVANIARGHREHDSFLVRHLYDLCMLDQKGFLDEQFYRLIRRIVEDDAKQYRTHNSHYASNPFDEIRFALDHLATSPKWCSSWKQFVNAMVFRQQAPTYQVALSTLDRVSGIILNG